MASIPRPQKLPPPKTFTECKDRLALYHGTQVVNDSRVKGKINDYANYESGSDASYPVLWEEVLAEADTVRDDLVSSQEGINPYEREDSFDKKDAEDRGAGGGNAGDRNKSRYEGGVLNVLTDADKERMKAICARCAQDAMKQPRVILFREKCLNNRHLSSEECSEMLRSPGLGYFTMKDLLEGGISLTSASKAMDFWQGEDGSEHITVRFSSPCVTMTAVNRLGSITFPSGSLFRFGVQVGTVKGSVLGWLVALAGKLASDFQWPAADTIAFLLSGEPPVHLNITTSTMNLMLSVSPWPSGLHPPPIRGMISLQVPYWFSAKQVTSLYGYLSAGMQGRFRNTDLQFTSLAGRPPEARDFRLFQFIEQQRAELGLVCEMSKWNNTDKKKVQRRWNETCIVNGHQNEQFGEIKRLVERYTRVSKNYRQQITGLTQAQQYHIDTLPQPQDQIE